MQKCYCRSVNDYFQVEQFPSRSFKVRLIFHASSWAKDNNVPVSKSKFRNIALHKTQLAHCSAIRLDIFTEGHFHISL